MKNKLSSVLIFFFFITNYCYSNEIKNYNFLGLIIEFENFLSLIALPYNRA